LATILDRRFGRGPRPPPGVRWLLERRTDTLARERLVGETRDQVQMRVEDLLPSDGAAVPAQVVAVRPRIAIEHGLGALHQREGVRPLLGREVEWRRTMRPRDDHHRADQDGVTRLDDNVVHALEQYVLRARALGVSHEAVR
jgi:hypothetical protein